LLNLLTVHRAELFSSMRELIWREAEEEKHALLSRAAGHAAQGRVLGSAGESSFASWAHPWKNRAAFDKDVDSLQALLWKRADCAAFITDTLGWREGELESVEGRKMAARKEKMTKGINNAAPPLGPVGSEHGSVSDVGTNDSAVPRHFSQDSGADISPAASSVSQAAGAAADRSSSPQRNARGQAEAYSPGPPAAGRRASSALSMSPAMRGRGATSGPPRPSTSGSVGAFGEPRTGPFSQFGSTFPGQETPLPVGDTRRTSRVSSAASVGPAEDREDEPVPATGQRRSSSVAGSTDGSLARGGSPAEPTYIGVLGFFESTGFTAKGKADESSAAVLRPFSARARSFSSTKGMDGVGGPLGASGLVGATPSQRASRLQPHPQPRTDSPQPLAAAASAVASAGTTAPASSEVATPVTPAAAAPAPAPAPAPGNLAGAS
jgi:hypothetical protein